MEWRYRHVWGAMHEAILKYFLQFQSIKLSRVFQTLLREYVNGERHSKHLSLLKKVFELTAFVLS